MNSQNLLARAIFRNVLIKRNGSHYGKRVHPIVTLNDMPTPKGDFFALQAKRNSKNNLVLAIGIASLCSAFYVWKESGLNRLHASPPDTYE